MEELKVKNINLTLMWNAVTRTGIVNEDNSSLGSSYLRDQEVFRRSMYECVFFKGRMFSTSSQEGKTLLDVK